MLFDKLAASVGELVLDSVLALMIVALALLAAAWRSEEQQQQPAGQLASTLPAVMSWLASRFC